MRWPATAALALAAALASPSFAHAEEGLFVARVVSGAATVGADTDALGGLVAGSVDLCIGERTGVLAGTEYVWRDDGSTLSFGAAVKHQPYEGEWSRLYLYLGPAVQRVAAADDDASYALAGQAGVGFEYLFMWGLGASLELRATAPMAKHLDDATLALGAGLFTEF